MCKLENAPTIGYSSLHFEKNLLKHNVTAQTEWSDTRALDWPHEASGLFGWNHCCPGLAHKIQHFVKNRKSGREALVYKQGTQEPQAWLIGQNWREILTCSVSQAF
jgi:hypothetical protein